VKLGRVDLEQILCHQDERVVGRDNTVAFEGRALQIPPQPGRRSCAGLRVTVRRHLEGAYSIWVGTRRLAQYAAEPEPARQARRASRPMEGLYLIKRSDHVSNGSGQITCQQQRS
jgi:hypothetical protein